jgi:hypothetical protein
MLFSFCWIFIVIYSLAIFYLRTEKTEKNISKFCIYENILFIEENKLI